MWQPLLHDFLSLGLVTDSVCAVSFAVTSKVFDVVAMPKVMCRHAFKLASSWIPYAWASSMNRWKRWNTKFTFAERQFQVNQLSLRKRRKLIFQLSFHQDGSQLKYRDLMDSIFGNLTKAVSTSKRAALWQGCIQNRIGLSLSYEAWRIIYVVETHGPFGARAFICFGGFAEYVNWQSLHFVWLMSDKLT